MNTSGLKDKIIVGAYCSPQPGANRDGVNYPSKITLQQYIIAKECGVNLIYGHNEVFGTDTEEDALLAMDYCEKVGIFYLVRDEISNEYISLGERGYKDYNSLNLEQKENLNDRFRMSIKKYKKHKAFLGISFFDEPGDSMFAGIADAEKIFLEECPDKLFYVNMIPYVAMPRQYQFGYVTKKEDAVKDEYSLKYTNQERYDSFFKQYIKIVKPQFYSFDAYPFMNYENITTAVHRLTYDIQQLCAFNQKNTNIPYWTFLQAGGKWEGSDVVRVPNKNEMRFQVNLALCFGAQALQFFPYCFPNDWLGDKMVEAGLIDKFGIQTSIYFDAKEALMFVHKIEKIYTNSHFVGLKLFGEYLNGLPNQEELNKVKWNETIFDGNLLPNYNIYEQNMPRMQKIQSSSQILISHFLHDNDDVFMILNNSTTQNTNVNITLKNNFKIRVISAKDDIIFVDNSLNFINMLPGECNMVIIEEII